MPLENERALLFDTGPRGNSIIGDGAVSVSSNGEHPIKKFLPELILASQSAARRALLESYGCVVHTSPTHSDEYHGGKVGLEVVRDLAERKLHSYLSLNPAPHLPVLTADTLISCDGVLVGKAYDGEEARKQLALFSGRSHQVCSGFALYLPSQGLRPESMVSGSDETTVVFRKLDESEIDTYIEGGDWAGAAGSYRIQGEAQKFITHLNGDVATVVGLPIQAISAILSSPASL